MSEAKILMFSIGAILFLGILFTNIVGNFSDTQDLNDTWVTNLSLDSVAGGFIDGAKYIVSSPVWLVESITNFFDKGETSSITIQGTGYHNNQTLDGEYVQVSENRFENKIERRFLFFWDLAQIRVNLDSNNNVTGANITTNFLDEDQVYKAINIDTGEWYYDWELTATNLTFNSFATAEASDTYINPPLSATGKIMNFFEEIKENVVNSVKTFGLIPQGIGIPILIILIIGIIYAIIKLLPWT